MTKTLLTIGHICTLRDGSVAVILSDKLGNLRVTNRRLALTLNHFNDDLTHRTQSRYDIISVSETPSFILSIQHLFDVDTSKYPNMIKPLWSREPEYGSTVDAVDDSSDEVNAFDAMVNATRKLFPNINVQVIRENDMTDVPTAIRDIVAKLKAEIQDVKANSKPQMEEIAKSVSAKISEIKSALESFGASADTIQKAVEDYVASLNTKPEHVSKEPEVGEDIDWKESAKSAFAGHEPVSIDESLIIRRNDLGTFTDEEFFKDAYSEAIQDMKDSYPHEMNPKLRLTVDDMFNMYVKTVVKSIKKFNKKFGYNPNAEMDGDLVFKSSGDKDMYMMLFMHYTQKHNIQMAETKFNSISEE